MTPNSSAPRSLKWLGASPRSLSITLLVVQNAVLVLVMYYSRIMPLVDGHRYLPSTAVLISEIIKLSISLTMALYELTSKDPNAPATTLFSELFGSIFSGDSWKLALPAMLYILQNNLQYLAASNLNPASFQITYQLKLVSTATFSVMVLGKSLSLRKWLSLLLVVAGVTIVQRPGISFTEDLHAALKDGDQLSYWLPKAWLHRKALSRRALDAILKRSATYQGIDEDFSLHNPRLNGTIGVTAVVVACICSGLAGAYVEKLLREHSARYNRAGARANVSLWVRNVQLSFWSIFPALFLGVVWKDGESISRHGFWAGYNWVVWLVIVLQAFGGIAVALVIDNANNVGKVFGTSISAIICFIVGFSFFDLSISTKYLLGTMLVIGGTWLFHSPESVRGPSVIVEDYEKQSTTRAGQGYFDLAGGPSPSVPTTPLGREVAYSSSSRPGSPDRGHFRNSQGKRQNDKRDV